MRIPILLTVIIALVVACTSFDRYVSPGDRDGGTLGATQEKPVKDTEYKEEKVDQIKADAIYDLTPLDFFRRQKELIGKTISFKGVIVEQPDILSEGDFLEVHSITRFREVAIRFVVQFDKPLPKPSHISDSAPFFSAGRAIQIFGKFLGNRQYLSFDGRMVLVPTIQAMMIYGENDFTYSKPEWATDTLRTAFREGEVTIDTMKVFWQKEPDSASVADYKTKETVWTNFQQIIAKVREGANSSMSNLSIIKKEKELQGTVLSIEGVLQKETVAERSDIAINQEYIEVVDSSAQRFSDFVIYLDHPFSIQLSSGEVRVFGTLISCREYINKFGWKVYLPALQGSLIYDSRDTSFAKPLWVSDKLLQQR